MIQHIRTLALPIPYIGTELDLDIMADEPEDITSEQESLEHLLKYALKTLPEQSETTGRVWQQLSRRVLGPFGGAALEAPAFSGLEIELMASGGRSRPTPFVLSDRVRAGRPQGFGALDSVCEMLRLDIAGRSRNSCGLVLA